MESPPIITHTNRLQFRGTHYKDKEKNKKIKPPPIITHTKRLTLVKTDHTDKS